MPSGRARRQRSSARGPPSGLGADQPGHPPAAAKPSGEARWSLHPSCSKRTRPWKGVPPIGAHPQSAPSVSPRASQCQYPPHCSKCHSVGSPGRRCRGSSELRPIGRGRPPGSPLAHTINCPWRGRGQGHPGRRLVRRTASMTAGTDTRGRYQLRVTEHPLIPRLVVAGDPPGARPGSGGQGMGAGAEDGGAHALPTGIDAGGRGMMGTS